MKKLLLLELERFSLKPHFIGLAIANVLILGLGIFMSTFLASTQAFMVSAGMPVVSLNTISLCNMLVRATLIVWQGVLIAKLIVEEYQNKTMTLLYTYPLNRRKLIAAKLIFIISIMLLFHFASGIFQNSMVYFLSQKMSFLTYVWEPIVPRILVVVSTILLSLIPLSVGMNMRSSIATIVVSVIIVVFASNSQGSTAGLLSIPVIAIILGGIGLIVTAITVRSMVKADLC